MLLLSVPWGLLLPRVRIQLGRAVEPEYDKPVLCNVQVSSIRANFMDWTGTELKNHGISNKYYILNLGPQQNSVLPTSEMRVFEFELMNSLLHLYLSKNW